MLYTTQISDATNNIRAPPLTRPSPHTLSFPQLLSASFQLSFTFLSAMENEPSLADIPFEHLQTLRSDGTGVHKFGGKKGKQDLSRDNKNM